MNMQTQLQAAIDEANKQTDERIEKCIAEMLPELERDDSSSVASCPQLPSPGNDTDAKPEYAVKPLSEKAVQMKVSTKSVSLTKRDHTETAKYAAGSVHTHLFKDQGNPVRKMVAKFREVAKHLNDNTVPWDVGIRMAKIVEFQSLMGEIRAKRDEAFRAREVVLQNYPTIYANEVSRLQHLAASTNKPHLADASIIPTQADIEAMDIDISMSTIPDPNNIDPRLGNVDDVITGQIKLQADAVANGTKHLINELIEPMTKMAEHLAKPVEDVHAFHKSLVDNMVHASDRMNRANLSDDPAVQKQIDDLKTLASSINKKTVGHDQLTRTIAKTNIETLMSQMEGLV